MDYDTTQQCKAATRDLMMGASWQEVVADHGLADEDLQRYLDYQPIQHLRSRLIPDEPPRPRLHK